MSAIEFSNERSSENEMDWIRKTNAILSSKLSHRKRRREILPRRYKNNTHARRQYAKEREKEYIESKVCSLSSHHSFLVRSLSETSFCAETKGKILKQKCAKN